ncbi:MAG: DUF4339 domain-containing protein [Planctomycetaceae bacterium]|nr:DUF4339 domain-containing protein [Planctomycetaceae bacterium]MCB9953533.1 DUF4339 domain-containing protein [Planctomycetaceae bacterium]
MSEASWYYKLLGEELGPVTLTALRDLVRDEYLGPEDVVRHESASEWQSVSQVAELQDLAELADSDDLDSMLADSDDMAGAFDIDNMLVEEASLPAPAPHRVVPRWYCKVLNQELGPFEYEALRLMAESGEVGKSDLIRAERDEEWVKASTIQGLFTGIKREKISNGDQKVTNTVSHQRAAVKPVQWECQILGQEYGPFDTVTLHEMARKGELAENDFVRSDRNPEWVPASTVPGIEFSSPQVMTPAASESKTAKVSESRPSSPAEPQAERPPTQPAPARPTPTAPTSRAYSPPPVSASPPPPPPSNRTASVPPRPVTPKKSSSGGGLSFNFKLDPKILGGIGAVVLLVLLYFFMPPMFEGDKGEFKQVAGVWKQIISLDQSNASEEEWKKFAATTRPLVEQHAQSLKSREQTAVIKPLVQAYDECLPKIFSGPEEERKQAISTMRKYIQDAANAGGR